MGKSGMIIVLAIVWSGMAAAMEGVISGPVRVVDGDTLVVAEQKIRLHGIDAPEQDQTCIGTGGVVWGCGAWVTAEVKARFDGRPGICRAVEKDRYNRTVAICTVGGVDMGEVIVGDGLAFAYQRYSMAYVAAEKRAAISSRGLHGQQVQSPAAFRKRALPAQASPGNCVIKGNISASGKIFHVPGQRDYARTRISTRKGERWFCSAAEARAAGWRAARR